MPDGKLQRCSSLEQPGEKPKNNGCYPVKVGKCGRNIKLNTGKALCILARDYKGFGNQKTNGVIERI